jgi:hypothetical protein
MTAPPTIAPVARTGRGTSTRFYVCVTVLLLVAVGMQAASGMLGTYFRKAPLPLKRSLDLLDQSKLRPEYVPHRKQPELLTHDALENLGTEEYLHWNLTDQRREHGDPTAVAGLLITYHTGGPGLVPHYPEECLAASGMKLKERENVEIRAPGPDGVEQAIPVKVLEFELPQRGASYDRNGSSERRRLVVAYFFLANGRYATTRTEVRRAVSNLRDRYAYYSKIEISFSDDSFQRFADREQTVAATARLLQKLMPILWEDHYQDWTAIKSGVPPVVAD